MRYNVNIIIGKRDKHGGAILKRSLVIVLNILVFVFLLSGCAKNLDSNAKRETENIDQEDQEDSKVPQGQVNNNSEKLIEAEQLISKAEAENLLGEPVKAAELTEQEGAGLKLCVYKPVDEKSTKYLQIGITQQAFIPRNSITPKSIYTALRENLEGIVFAEGVGDEAFLAPPGLHIISGDYYINIAVGKSEDVTIKKVLIATGLKAVENLKKAI